MAGSINKVIIVGNLGSDPEIRTAQDGRKVATLSIATSEIWRDKSTGERKEKTEWHRVVVFNEGLCKVIESYLTKGSKVYLEGQLQTRKWEKDGVERYTTEIVLQGFNSNLTMLDNKSNDQSNQPNQYAQETGAEQPSGASGLDDDIPFAAEYRV